MTFPALLDSQEWDKTQLRNVPSPLQPELVVELFLLEKTMASICTEILKPPLAPRQHGGLRELVQTRL